MSEFPYGLSAPAVIGDAVAVALPFLPFFSRFCICYQQYNYAKFHGEANTEIKQNVGAIDGEQVNNQNMNRLAMCRLHVLLVWLFGLFVVLYFIVYFILLFSINSKLAHPPPPPPRQPSGHLNFSV